MTPPDRNEIAELRERLAAEFSRSAEREAASRPKSLRSRRLRLAAAVVAVGIVIPAGLAAAGVLPGDGERGDDETRLLSVGPGDSLGFIDRESGEPLICPDGEPLTHTVRESSFLPPDLDPREAGTGGRVVLVNDRPGEGVDLRKLERVFAGISEPRCIDGNIPPELERMLVDDHIDLYRIGG